MKIVLVFLVIVGLFSTAWANIAPGAPASINNIVNWAYDDDEYETCIKDFGGFLVSHIDVERLEALEKAKLRVILNRHCQQEFRAKHGRYFNGSF
jgi:hypothetical protein